MGDGPCTPGTSFAELRPAAVPTEVPGGCQGPSEAGPAGQAAPALAGPPDLWPGLLLLFPPGYCRHGAVLATMLRSCSPLVSQTSVRHFLLSLLPYKCFICKLDPHNNSTRWEVLLSVYRWGNRGTELVRSELGPACLTPPWNPVRCADIKAAPVPSLRAPPILNAGTLRQEEQSVFIRHCF